MSVKNSKLSSQKRLQNEVDVHVNAIEIHLEKENVKTRIKRGSEPKQAVDDFEGCRK